MPERKFQRYNSKHELHNTKFTDPAKAPLASLEASLASLVVLVEVDFKPLRLIRKRILSFIRHLIVCILTR